ERTRSKASPSQRQNPLAVENAKKSAAFSGKNSPRRRNGEMPLRSGNRPPQRANSSAEGETPTALGGKIPLKHHILKSKGHTKMKSYVTITLIFTFLLMAIPAFSLLKAHELPPAATDFSETEVSAPEKKVDNENFLVLKVGNGQVEQVSKRDYIIGAVFAEMPASFHPEALKAQAVAAHTYAVRQREKELVAPTVELQGAYFSDDATKYQAYFTTEEAKLLYGDKYAENYAKISSAVDAVIDEILTYNNEPIVAAFHSMSSGITESSENVWGNALPYLVPADSKSDTTSPNFTEVKTFSTDEFSARLKTAYPDISLSPNPAEWLTIGERTPSGTVKSLTVGGKALTGAEFRTTFSLRSANFTAAFADGNFTVSTSGYGHGVGLSQYGANALANEGKITKV
ncbi:MAG: stage II sporulation protein D, partial [Oscillospiraceae bacterium]